MHVVCAPNAFKGTLDAAVAAGALVAGARRAGATAQAVPVADGGDGTLDVLVANAGTTGWIESHTVRGPLGAPTPARLGWIDDKTAVVELAEAAGLRLLAGSPKDALAASTFGVGELIAAAIDSGALRILVGLGGSATTDAGRGILEALGATFWDGIGGPVPRGGGATAWVANVDFAPARARVAGVRLEVAVDVDNPLYGEQGAAYVFAPQKGASASQVADLDAGLRRFATLIERVAGKPGMAVQAGMGAAGGSAFGLACLDATLRPGAALVCDECHLDEALVDADLVITGEGRIDSQTSRGKAPAEVAMRCLERGISCVAVAGIVEDPLPDLFESVVALGTAPGDADATRRRLELMGAKLVARWRRQGP